MKVASIQNNNVFNSSPSFGKIRKVLYPIKNGCQITKIFNNNLLIGMQKTYPDGTLDGFRKYAGGYRVDYYTTPRKIESYISRNGQDIGHSSGDAYKANGKLNIVTLKEIKKMLKMADEALKNKTYLSSEDIMKIFS